MAGAATSVLDMTAVSAVATALSAVVTAVAAIGVFLQVKAASRTNAAQLFVSFSKRYNSPQMAAALRGLATWRLSTPDDDFASRWLDAKEAGDPEALSLNEQRRLVSRFYLDIARLYDSDLIDRKHARDLLANNGLNVYYRVCEPMNVSRHSNRSPRLPQVLKSLIPSYGDGELHGASPAQMSTGSRRRSPRKPQSRSTALKRS